MPWRETDVEETTGVDAPKYGWPAIVVGLCLAAVSCLVPWMLISISAFRVIHWADPAVRTLDVGHALGLSAVLFLAFGNAHIGRVLLRSLVHHND